MKNFWLKPLTFLLALAPLILSCTEDDNLPSPKKTETEADVNINSNTKGTAFARLEFPHLKADNNNIVVLHSTNDYGFNFAVEWDCTKKAQRWSCYEMNPGNSVVHWKRAWWKDTSWGGDPFQEDPDLPETYRTHLSDYKYTGYDRGHICPSADRQNSQEANEQTYYLSNMQPQIHGFNAGVWLNMENTLRNKWNTSAYRDILYVCKGGTIDKKSQIAGYTRKSKLIVPKYFFAAILAVKNGQYHAIGLWFEHKKNNDDNLANYAMSIDRLEQLTGIDFFCNLPDKTEDQVESNIDLAWWGL